MDYIDAHPQKMSDAIVDSLVKHCATEIGEADDYVQPSTMKFENGNEITCLPSQDTIRGQLHFVDDFLVNKELIDEIISPFLKQLNWWQRLKVKLYGKLSRQSIYLSSGRGGEDSFYYRNKYDYERR